MLNSLIHRFSQNGVNIIADINSGAVHVVDALVDAMLSHEALFLKGDGRMRRHCRL